MIEFGLSRQLSRIVTVTDLRLERILRRAGRPLERIGEPQNDRRHPRAGRLSRSVE